MLDPALQFAIAFGVTAVVTALPAALAVGLLSAKRRLRAMTRDRDGWRKAYNHEVKQRLYGIDENHRLRRLATRNAHEVDRLRGMLKNAHYRDPETGRLAPRGQFPLPITPRLAIRRLQEIN